MNSLENLKKPAGSKRLAYKTQRYLQITACLKLFLNAFRQLYFSKFLKLFFCKISKEGLAFICIYFSCCLKSSCYRSHCFFSPFLFLFIMSSSNLLLSFPRIRFQAFCQLAHCKSKFCALDVANFQKCPCNY